jgi:hypothetical protein
MTYTEADFDDSLGMTVTSGPSNSEAETLTSSPKPIAPYIKLGV